jgi:hypothetical protein
VARYAPLVPDDMRTRVSAMLKAQQKDLASSFSLLAWRSEMDSGRRNNA